MTTSEIARLFRARRSGRYKGRPSWQAKCPCHRDRMASLSITEPEPGRTKVKCFAGCDEIDVLANIGLTIGDLYAEKRGIPPSPAPDWIENDGPVWFEGPVSAMAMAVICAVLLAVPERDRGPLMGVWDKSKGPIPDPDSLVSGRWDYRPPDDYVVNPMLRNSVLQGELKRAIISWYRLRANDRREAEVQRIIAEYGIEELWDCLPKPV